MRLCDWIAEMQDDAVRDRLGPVERHLASIVRTQKAHEKKLNNIERLLVIMGQREDAADARFIELVELVRQGSAAKDAEIAALRAELEGADAEAAARVEAALATDSEFDAEKKEQGNAALEELIAQAPPAEEPPAEEPPVEEEPTPAA